MTMNLSKIENAAVQMNSFLPKLTKDEKRFSLTQAYSL
jgi:hypothetical protein